jgi:hypothetical protein
LSQLDEFVETIFGGWEVLGSFRKFDSQAPNSKHQKTNKFKIQNGEMTETKNRGGGNSILIWGIWFSKSGASGAMGAVDALTYISLGRCAFGHCGGRFSLARCGWRGGIEEKRFLGRDFCWAARCAARHWE